LPRPSSASPHQSDVFVLAQHFRKDQLLLVAEEIDPGFDRDVLRQMFSTLNRFVNEEIFAPDGDVAQLRTFFGDWADQLANQTSTDMA
jgi:hypothetical protein